MYPHVRQFETQGLESERELRLRTTIRALRAGAPTPGTTRPRPHPVAEAPRRSITSHGRAASPRFTASPVRSGLGLGLGRILRNAFGASIR